LALPTFDTLNKSIFEYEDIKGEAHEQKVKNINPYLIEAKDILIDKRSSNPICKVPQIFESECNLLMVVIYFFQKKKKMNMYHKNLKAKKSYQKLVSGA
jgi:hypothetical protein